MKKQLLLLLFFLTVTFKIISQENRKFLYATIKDKVGAVANAHIINKKTNQGTYTNEEGEFRILAKVNDSLQISFVGYKTTFLIVKIKHFGMFKNNIYLEKETLELDEIILKKHNLEGVLSIDIKQTPENKINKIVANLVNGIKNIDFEKITTNKIDVIDRSKAPDMQKQTDPTAKFAGVGGGFSEGIDQHAAEKRRLRKEIKYKENFPEMLISEFGEKFFFVDLKIPKEKYHHFLAYCNPLAIENLYKKGNILEVIKIIRQESESYLKVINLPNE
ncbi:carboxypeptidase-like regulatory domain-containing protein [Tenacibaculum retecalamus]|uniref:carboxypeptidase-like regulatory domain-containing protein n=1 Tax=Tenacibaculum retecalamus TaxID=3018315 RepID=UPI0023D900F9|nr:carboxypeptidase-like regulatory domain-containing protein [Tenacibaculum retecalamus]WBX72286.1 carboxypeptidase-like regulatory domain-containing protein [Tenacibaculum retecalamus]